MTPDVLSFTMRRWLRQPLRQLRWKRSYWAFSTSIVIMWATQPIFQIISLHKCCSRYSFFLMSSLHDFHYHGVIAVHLETLTDMYWLHGSQTTVGHIKISVDMQNVDLDQCRSNLAETTQQLRSKPGCKIVGSVTIVWLTVTTQANNQFSDHCGQVSRLTIWMSRSKLRRWVANDIRVHKPVQMA